MKIYISCLPNVAFNFQGLGTIQILSDSLPKIVPYVLINHREVCELLFLPHFISLVLTMH